MATKTYEPLSQPQENGSKDKTWSYTLYKDSIDKWIDKNFGKWDVIDSISFYCEAKKSTTLTLGGNVTVTCSGNTIINNGTITSTGYSSFTNDNIKNCFGSRSINGNIVFSFSCNQKCTFSLRNIKIIFNYTEHVHSWIGATCYEPKTCSVCGVTEGSALGHSFTNYVPYVPATCEYPGTEISKCDRCDVSNIRESDKLPPIGHNYVGRLTKAPTCTEPGVMTYTCQNDASHSYTEGVTELGHKYVGVVTKEATCTEKGVMTYTCENDPSHSYTEEIPLKDHEATTGVEENLVEPTCTDTGSCDLVTYCVDCNHEMMREKITIRPLGHSFTNYVYDNDATCEADGTKVAKCDRCDATDVIPYEGSALGHYFILSEHIPASPNSLGYDIYKCSRCEKTDVRDYTALITCKYDLNMGEVWQYSTGHYGGYEYLQNSTVTLIATPNDGYKFLRWSTGETYKEITVVASESTEYEAIFIPSHYTIKFVNDDGTELQSSLVEYETTPSFEGTPQKEPTATHTFKFKGWVPSIVPVTGDAVYTATYEAKPRVYKVTTAVYPQGTGSVSGVLEGEQFLYEDTVHLEAIPNEGYEFVQWDDGNTDIERTVTVREETTYTAIFRTKHFHFFIDHSSEHDMGTITGPDEDLYEIGTEIIVTANPLPGYKFVKWKVIEGENERYSTDNPLSIVLNSDTSVEAIFDVDPPEFTSVQMLYQDKQISETNKVPTEQGFIIFVQLR